MSKKVEMIGKRYGFLTVLSETDYRSCNGDIKYLCQCDCGTKKIIDGRSMRTGVTLSCGCYNKVKSKKDNPKYKTKLYGIYHSMNDRCSNKNNKSYHNYGGRGIKVSEKWSTFEQFKEWSEKNGYEQGLWIDRINNDGDYSPDNCRWTTPKVQQNNKRQCVYLTINGERKTITGWADLSGIKPSTLRRRIAMNWDEDKLFSPVQTKFSHSEAIKAGIKKKVR